MSRKRLLYYLWASASLFVAISSLLMVLFGWRYGTVTLLGSWMLIMQMYEVLEN